jgi:hypothetical protein
VATLVQGGLGCLRLSHAESTVQGGLAAAGGEAADPCRRQKMRACGAMILAGVTLGGLTKPVSRTFAKQGLAGPLLQVRTI